MSLLSQVVAATGATRADVARVATQGGHTQDDWAIAHAIQTITGRSAYELMYTAGRAADIAQIWADTGTPAEAPAPVNPRAEYVEDVTVYAEDTSPESPNRVSPDHLSDTTEAPTEDEQLRTQAWAAIAAITNAPREVIDRMVARWTTTTAIYTGLANVLRSSRHPRARRLHATYVTAA
ncbi:hypothetical protein ACWGKS_27155 [Nocardiopsis sp. NPDC055879]